jgi:hypothetical protein
MKAFQHKSNLKHTAVLLFGIMMSCATVKAQDIPCLPSSFGETDSQSAWCGIVAYTLHITAYGESTSEGGWYLIASPVGSVVATDVVNLVASTTPEDPTNFDLYRFNEAADLEWENWKKPNEGEINHYHFGLEPGRGYLYANAANVTLVFAGTPYSGDGIVTLQKTEGAELSGWNLVGNPFADSASLSQPYYRMNADGSALNTSTEDTEVAAMEGVFVKADEDGQTVTFTAQTRGGEQSAVAALNIFLSKVVEPVETPVNRGDGPSTGSGTSILDNAILRFDGGQTLEKFSFREGSTKLYIPQDGTDYAIACAESTGEMPLNFKANADGQYTLTVSATANSQQPTVNYLHLIDNMTGADVDLLTSPNYTFTAKTTDYESRFKLVFAVGSSTGSDTFAFFSNGNIIVNGEGMLQVIDMTGRVVYQGDAMNRVSTDGMTAGVYVLRLINGENVRTQKIVIE